jgi:predicted amidohydrolase
MRRWGSDRVIAATGSGKWRVILPKEVTAMMVETTASIRVAAIQMQAGLGDVDGNLKAASDLVEEAVRQGARLVVLPEFFTSAMAMHRHLLEAPRSIEGEPTRLLRDLARRHGILVGGSFLAIHPDAEVRNTFVLVGPDGVVGMHDKDLPTMWENCYYAPGHDPGILETPLGAVGVALCWEFVRSQTVRRLRGRVRLVIGGSCWWDVPYNLPPRRFWNAVHEQNLRLWRQTLPTFARLVGAPVVHASWCGDIEGKWALGTRYVTRYVTDAAIVAADGAILAQRGPDEGPGVIIADLELGDPQPQGEVPDHFWLHDILRTPHWRFFWWFQNIHGRLYRRLVIRRHLAHRKARGPVVGQA